MKRQDHFYIRHASENNLRSVSLAIPKHKLVVVTGVSGSGKSSLIFDVLYREAERRYLATFTAYARQLLQRIRQPEVESVTGLTPAIAISQRAITRNPRSTVGTLSEIYDYLRLLYARTGTPVPGYEIPKLSRSLFSFNAPEGACPVCKGLGVEDRLDPELLVGDPTRSIRQGALVITAPNGYIIYSQVTLDVLNQICATEGFTIDIPWNELTSDQKEIILYGSSKTEIPFGKHPLESRMKWSGITAKPREMGYYKGIIPVMETILKRERNKNILRFVRTTTCQACRGKRLNDNALSVTIGPYTIADLAALPLHDLAEAVVSLLFPEKTSTIGTPIVEKILEKTRILQDLGLDYLSCDRESTTLSAGEAQRIRLAVQLGMGLQGLTYILDEPSVGLHPHDSRKVINALKKLRDKGNSVIVIEHEEAFIREADWLIDIGPGPGTNGGEILVNSSVEALTHMPAETISTSRTLQYLLGIEKTGSDPRTKEQMSRPDAEDFPEPPQDLTITGASLHNLRNIDVHFKPHALNVVTGVSGAGKSTLVNHIIGSRTPGSFQTLTGWEQIQKIIRVDQAPIGKTSRSNPATYTGLFDLIRELYASLPDAQEKGFGKNRFSFNTPGGRCEDCQGAGFHQIGMHFMGTIEVPCETCRGSRFHDDTLSVHYRKKNIADVLLLTIDEASRFFHDQPVILPFLTVLQSLGLGYLQLGQRSSTLSGGEAQRIKLATELVRPASGNTLYLLDEPTSGLHHADVDQLLTALRNLITHRNTVIVIEHHHAMILAADHVVDLGPGSGRNGGTLVASGPPRIIMETPGSVTGQELAASLHLIGKITEKRAAGNRKTGPEAIMMTRVTTNNLKGISVSIPHGKITVITGVSGSGKSSLAFDTLYAEGRNRFLESFSAYARAQLGIKEKPDAEQITGLTPTLAVNQQHPGSNPRSTVGTFTGLYDLMRLFFSRFSTCPEGNRPRSSSLFSFNDTLGACPACDGLGMIHICDPRKLITLPGKPLHGGALSGTRTGRFYGDPDGQYMYTLLAAGERHGLEFSLPWNNLSDEARHLALYGSGEEIYDIVWHFRRKERTGSHRFQGKWIGLTELVNSEYKRKHADHRGTAMMDVMQEITCPHCNGYRLRPEVLRFKVGDADIGTITELPFRDLIIRLDDLQSRISPAERSASEVLTGALRERLKVILELGLGYIFLNRPVETLSGGEFQRIKLAGQIGSGLEGITYVLDEPTAGLHPADTGQLLDKIRELAAAGNTVVMVEHDPEVIRAADYVIDLGPGPGTEGGEIVAAGTPTEIMNQPASLTGLHLKIERLQITSRHRPCKPGIAITGAFARNLRDLSVTLPAGAITVVTGVSGSGKSTLVHEVLESSFSANRPTGCLQITGTENLLGVINVSEKKRFSDGKGTPGTFLGVFDPVRDLYASTEEARRYGLSKRHFSFLSAEGRCPVCNGLGETRISMDFMADVVQPCESCGGTRYQPQILQVLYHGTSIADVLRMTFREAGTFFELVPVIEKKCREIIRLGLGYIRLGQPLESLSGGESQRLALLHELFSSAGNHRLFLFDEPTGGLHPADLPPLIGLFDDLADKGHTLVIIEHNPAVILHADNVVDLGPGGGDRGGCIVYEGGVAGLLQSHESVTGRWLKKICS